MKKRPASTEIRQSYPDWKAESDRINAPYSHYILGELSIRLTPYFIGLGLRANAITAGSFVLLLVALGLVAGGAWSHGGFIAGSLLLHGVLILDNVDGHVARFNGSESKLGEFSDSFVTWFHYTTLPVCIGVALYAAEAEWWIPHAGVSIPGWVWIGTAAVRSICYLFSVVVGERSRQLLRVGGYEERVNSVASVVFLKAIMEAEVLLLLLAAVCGVVGLVHLGYALLHVAVFGAVMVKNTYDLFVFDREHGKR